MAQASTSAGAASGEAALRGRPVSSVHLRCAATVTALALAALAGWATDVRLLATLLPGRPALSPMTASLLIVAAAALVALPARPRAASWLGLAEALAGVAIIVAHELAWLPGRPGWWSSQLTGLAFAVSGAATALLGRGRAVPGQLAAFALLLYAALLGIGHLIPEADLYRYLPGTGVAIPTVLSFIALSIGQLVPVEDRGYAHALSRRNTIGLFAKKLLIGGLAATLLLAVPAVLALRQGLFDAETAVLLVAWGAMALLSGTIWGLAVAVERAQAAAAAAEQGREAVRRMVVAAVTHDLRSPLQAAMLSAQVIAREPGAPRTAARCCACSAATAGWTGCCTCSSTACRWKPDARPACDARTCSCGRWWTRWWRTTPPCCRRGWRWTAPRRDGGTGTRSSAWSRTCSSTR